MKKLLSTCLLLCLLFVSGRAADPVSYTGTLTTGDGSYFYYQIAPGSHSMYVMTEAGIRGPGAHNFRVALPQAITVREIHGSSDYHLWCAGPAGIALGVQGGNGSSYDFLFLDKTSTLVNLHVPIEGHFDGGQVALTSIDFNYWNDLGCTTVTESHSFVLVY